MSKLLTASIALVAAVLISAPLAAQEAAAPSAQLAQEPGAPAVMETEHATIPTNRAYGVLPNYRTAELDDPFKPITTGQKFTIARKDTIDWPSYFVAGIFSGISQVNNSDPSFGQGAKGFAHRYVTSVADQDLGNFLTEAILPSLLHQDPRYFRKGHGSVGGRIWYAASRIAIAKSDSGRSMFNVAEFLGNGMVAAIGNAYYPDRVGFDPTMQRMFTQIGSDALSQVLKEFWPDVRRHMPHKKG